MTHDGLGTYLSQMITEGARLHRRHRRDPARDRTDVVVNYLPVGSEMATKWYVEQVLEAGCAFVNCIPVFIAPRGVLAARGSRSAGCRSWATT